VRPELKSGETRLLLAEFSLRRPAVAHEGKGNTVADSQAKITGFSLRLGMAGVAAFEVL